MWGGGVCCWWRVVGWPRGCYKLGRAGEVVWRGTVAVGRRRRAVCAARCRNGSERVVVPRHTRRGIVSLESCRAALNQIVIKIDGEPSVAGNIILPEAEQTLLKHIVRKSQRH